MSAPPILSAKVFGGPEMDARDFRSFVEAHLPDEALHVVGGARPAGASRSFS